MKIVKIGFSKPTYKAKPFPIFSWLIRLFEGTPYSHVYIEFSSKYLNRDLVYEAAGLCVHFAGGKLFHTQVHVIREFKIQVSDAAYKRALQFAIDNTEKPYGVIQVLGLAYVVVMRRLGKRVKNPLGDGKASYVCSEIVARMVPSLKKEFKGRMDTVTPRDIYEKLTDI